jgi:hypothetical protein
MKRTSGGRAAIVTVALGLSAAFVGCAVDPDAAPMEEDDLTGTRQPPPPATSGPPAAEGDEEAAPTEETAPPLIVHALAHLGDSISQGFDADDSEPLDLNLASTAPEKVFKDAPALSWIQGTDARVASVAAHYRELYPDLDLTSLSRSGAEMAARFRGAPSFEDQARAIASRDAKPDLVYVLLGANDVCNRPRSTTADATETLYSVARFRAGVVKGLTALAETVPAGATVRVLSVPRADLLYDAAASASVPVTATLPSPTGPLRVSSTSTCKEVWNIAAAASNGVCAIVTTEPSAVRRAAIGARIDAYSDAIAEEIARFRGDAKLNPNGVIFQTDWHGSLSAGEAANSSVGTYKFTAAQISRRDCFHPSIAGQQALASFVLNDARWTP